MKTSSIAAIAALVVLASAGGYWWVRSNAPPKPYPRATAPPPPSPVFEQAKEPAPTQEQIERDALERNDKLALGIERALVSRDAVERETAFTHLLPQLLQFDPARVVAIFARLEKGESRDLLRTEIARLWITRDHDAAIDWLQTLDEQERRAGAAAAVDSLAASAPDRAIGVADRFEIGRDDGSLEHLVQIWATDNLAAAERWIATQPPGPKTEQLRARITLVRDQQAAARAARY